jgi:hypothetical protein
MISIIICSRTKIISSTLSENIESTIVSSYELIVIDNSENKYTIFEAYNEGIDRSKGKYLCFIHDDILFKTEGWGANINRIFSENLKIGLIGVAGAKSKTKMPSLWWHCPGGQNVLNIIQHTPNKEKHNWSWGFEESSNVEVVIVDGVFMAIRKDERIRFNSEMIGFHNYDLNISFEYIKNGYKIVVSNEILIEHFSTGTINKQWVESSYDLYIKYKDFLPLSLDNSEVNKKQEIVNAKKYLNECLKFKKYKIALTISQKILGINSFSNSFLFFGKTILKLIKIIE